MTMFDDDWWTPRPYEGDPDYPGHPPDDDGPAPPEEEEPDYCVECAGSGWALVDIFEDYLIRYHPELMVSPPVTVECPHCGGKGEA
jgi:hypothetical protein